jgi:hypothetical protein
VSPDVRSPGGEKAVVTNQITSGSSTDGQQVRLDKYVYNSHDMHSMRLRASHYDLIFRIVCVRLSSLPGS